MVSLSDGKEIDVKMKPGISLPSVAATIENFQKVIQEIDQKNSDQITIVYGGHGNQMGIAFWDRAVLNERQLRETYRGINPDTIVQSIFIQCHAASMLINHYRVLPSNLEYASRFLDTYYPQNRCGLAMSMQDELGQYFEKYDVKSDSRPSRWAEIRSQFYNPTLQNFLDYLEADSAVTPTPTLTSDYFIQDIQVILCKNKETKHSLAVYNTDSSLFEKICNNPAEVTYTQLSTTYSDKLLLTTNLWRLIIDWTRELIEKDFPNIAEIYKTQVEENKSKNLVSYNQGSQPSSLPPWTGRIPTTHGSSSITREVQTLL
jgi:predicted metal-dependent hydrolase